MAFNPHAAEQPDDTQANRHWADEYSEAADISILQRGLRIDVPTW